MELEAAGYQAEIHRRDVQMAALSLREKLSKPLWKPTDKTLTAGA